MHFILLLILCFIKETFQHLIYLLRANLTVVKTLNNRMYNKSTRSENRYISVPTSI